MIQISYPLTTSTPLYPGTPPLSISPVKDFSTGDSARTSLISFSSHAGTHIDLPSHVCREYPENYLFNWDEIRDICPCCCIDLKKEGEEPIQPVDLIRTITPDPELQVLLIRTGTWQIRSSVPESYSKSHPWLHPDCVSLLRQQFPSLRLLGVDLVSITNPAFREYGREAHRQLLCAGSPVLILEDLDLSSGLLTRGTMRLTIIPYVQEPVDGVPVWCSVDRI